MLSWDAMFSGQLTRVIVRNPMTVPSRQAIAEYSGCRKEQPHIKLFWQALREFTPQERSMLIKFTWGRYVKILQFKGSLVVKQDRDNEA